MGDNLRLPDLLSDLVTAIIAGSVQYSVCVCVFTILFHLAISNPRIEQKAESYSFL